MRRTIDVCIEVEEGLTLVQTSKRIAKTLRRVMRQEKIVRNEVAIYGPHTEVSADGILYLYRVTPDSGAKGVPHVWDISPVDRVTAG